MGNIPPLLTVAAKAAENSTYHHKLGAVIAKQGRPISKACNSIRSSRFSRLYPFPNSLHAEAAAILRFGRREIPHGAVLYVARINRKGELRCAKPCKHCQEVIKGAGIRNVIYSTNGGFDGMYL